MPRTQTLARITPGERAKFLELTRQGEGRQSAALAIGQTATMMRRVLLRDEELRLEYEEARDVARAKLIDELRAELSRRLIDEKTGSDALLVRALTTHDPEWAWMRDQRRGPDGTEGTQELPRPVIDVSLLTDGQVEELDRILRRAEELVAIGQGRAPNTEREALPAGPNSV